MTGILIAVSQGTVWDLESGSQKSSCGGTQLGLDLRKKYVFCYEELQSVIALVVYLKV